MCGILGIGRFKPNVGMYDCNVRAFQDMLLAGQVRGMDGTGIIKVRKNYTVQVRKIKGNTIDLLRAEGVAKWLGKSAGDCDMLLIGHNRFATTTNSTNAHAHPFITDHISLVHNGTLSNPDWLTDQKFPVDSQALTYAIAKIGVKEALLKACGAMSIVFYDETARTVNFYRNYQRPMYIHWNNTEKELIFGSETKMVEWAAHRNTMTTVSPKELPVLTWQSWDVETGERLPDVKIEHPTSVYQGNWSGQGTPNYASAAMTEADYDAAFDTMDACGINGESTTQRALPAPRTTEVESVGNDDPIVEPQAAVTRHSNRLGVQERLYMQELYGYKKDDKIQWAGVEMIKSSKTQDQYQVIGCIIDDKDDGQMAKVEVHTFVKGADLAQRLVDADWITATVRVMHKPRIGSVGAATILVTDPIATVGDHGEDVTETIPFTEVTPKETFGLTTPAVQVETKSKIVDLKGSTYDPNTTKKPPHLNKKSLGQIVAACVTAVTGNETKH